MSARSAMRFQRCICIRIGFPLACSFGFIGSLCAWIWLCIYFNNIWFYLTAMLRTATVSRRIGNHDQWQKHRRSLRVRISHINTMWNITYVPTPYEQPSILSIYGWVDVYVRASGLIFCWNNLFKITCIHIIIVYCVHNALRCPRGPWRLNCVLSESAHQ